MKFRVVYIDPNTGSEAEKELVTQAAEPHPGCGHWVNVSSVLRNDHAKSIETTGKQMPGPVVMVVPDDGETSLRACLDAWGIAYMRWTTYREPPTDDVWGYGATLQTAYLTGWLAAFRHTGPTATDEQVGLYWEVKSRRDKLNGKDW